ncbi:MAG: hypothetical protein GAK34_02052 [Delftia tsuruhatensis]|nr:MAG: hypothetical protein GAK34_02052 [Delftia tsuruhatensis]
MDTVAVTTRPMPTSVSRACVRSISMMPIWRALPLACAACISLKTSGSSTWRRMYSATGTISRPTAKGTRQAQAISSSSVKISVISVPVAAPISRASIWPAICQEP